jgi:hypothetical protein
MRAPLRPNPFGWIRFHLRHSRRQKHFERDALAETSCLGGPCDSGRE